MHPLPLFHIGAVGSTCSVFFRTYLNSDTFNKYLPHSKFFISEEWKKGRYCAIHYKSFKSFIFTSYHLLKGLCILKFSFFYSFLIYNNIFITGTSNIYTIKIIEKNKKFSRGARFH